MHRVGDWAVTRVKTLTTSATARPTYLSIQYLRAIAALMVVAWHAEGQVGLAGTRIFQSGIEFFFIISGFVMWIVSNDGESRPGIFMVRRLARVVPLYWVLTSVVAAVALLAPALLQSIRLEPAHLLASYAFAPWPNPTPGVGLRPLLIPGWTLNYEMAFYTLIAASLWAPRRWRGPLTVGMLAGASILGVLAPTQNPIFSFYTSPLVVEFALGIMLAIIVRALPSTAFRWGAPVMILGVGLLLVGGAVIDAEASWRLVLFGAPATLVVGGAALWERSGDHRVLAPLKLLGDASYPLYMIHTLILSAMVQVWRHAGLHWPPQSFVALGLVASCAVGVGLHFAVEKPLTRALQSRLTRQRGASAVGLANAPLAAPGPP